MSRLRRGLPRRDIADGVGHALLGVFEPLAGEGVQRVPANLLAQRQQLALADQGGTQHGKEVPVPLLGHPDAQLAHANDVVDGLVVLEDLHRRKDQRAFLVHIARRAVIGRRDRVSDIRLVCLGQDREVVRPRVVDHGHDDGVVRRVRAAVIGRVVQEGVALFQVRVKLLHGARHDVRTR